MRYDDDSTVSVGLALALVLGALIALLALAMLVFAN